MAEFGSREKFISAYQALVNEIRVEKFDAFKAHFTDAQDLQSLVREFQSELFETFIKTMNKLYEEADIDSNIQIMELMKSEQAGNQAAAWRPTGKLVTEQIRPLIANKLNWMLKFYLFQLSFQKDRTEALIVQIEEKRQELKAMEGERSRKQQQITNEKKKFENLEHRLKHLNQKINSACLKL
ncbi:uncharacterized protein LOC131216741 [Anopheles bellator]|uniref:uncharacterized protein LOC131216741 n=1 Tax=Anopheles bellator TaxID=139047 RepID=UPI002647E60C|nr:uncharacterized protein LOC131216741 [Anopheles bellator]